MGAGQHSEEVFDMRTSAEKYGLPDRQKSFGLMPMMSARKLERQPPDRFSSVHLYTVVGVTPWVA